MAGGTSHSIAGESLTLLAEKAVFWPATQSLIVADLHWGKAESFQRAGIPVSSEGFWQDLERLQALVQRTQAKRLICLGDLFHSRQAWQPPVMDAVSLWRQHTNFEFLWVRGNHDRFVREVPEAWRMSLIDDAFTMGPFLLSHELEQRAGYYTLYGHLHPVVLLRSRRERLRLPCFCFGEHAGVLPAFGYFTGGHPIEPTKADRIFAIADREVVAL